MIPLRQSKYLGLVITEHLDLNVTAQIVAQSATRALGILISKFKTHGGMPWITYTKLYHALVQPVLEYVAAVWAYKDCASIKAVQHRACRFFLGVGRYAPSSGVIGDMGWHPVSGPLWINVIREWCRLRSMKASRLNRQVFDFTTRPTNKFKSFSHHVQSFCEKVGLNMLFTEEVQPWSMVSTHIKQHVNDYFARQWYDEITAPVGPSKRGRNKLRTYAQFKTTLVQELYVSEILNRNHRSAIAKFRLGIAPIRLETDRYEGLPETERLCPLCQIEIENEEHVLIKCSFYDDIRNDLFNVINLNDASFSELLPCQKLVFVLSHPLYSNFVPKPAILLCKDDGICCIFYK